MDRRNVCQNLVVNMVTLLFCIFSISPALMAAQTITCGQTVTGTLGSSSDFRDYSFSGNKDETVVISLSGTTLSFLPSFDLLTPPGTSIGLLPVGSLHPVTLPITTTYTIRVHGPSAGGFVLGLYFATGHCGKPISCGSSVSASIDVPAQQVPYTFEAEAGQVVLFSAAKVSGTISPSATLYDPYGKAIGSATVGVDSKLITLSHSGRHTILVRDLSQSGGGTFGFSLHFTDGGCGTASNCGETKNGSIDMPGYEQAYRFDGAAGQVIGVGIKKSSGSLTPVASLYGPKGDLVASSGLLGKITDVSLRQDGHYTILVQAFMHVSTGGYELQLSCSGSKCSPSVSPITFSVPSNGGAGTVTITGPTGCTWAASSSEDWVTISKKSGSGSAALDISVTQNQDITPRVATLTIAGQTVAVSQPGMNGSLAKTLYYPRLVDTEAQATDAASAEYTGIALTNMDFTSAYLIATAFDTSGRIISGKDIYNPVTLVLAPGQQVAVIDYQMFGSGLISANKIGWFVIESDSNKVAGAYLFFNQNLTVLDGTDTSAKQLNEFVFPEIEPTGFTELDVANPTKESTLLTFELIGSDGVRKLSPLTRTVNASGSLVEFVQDMFSKASPNSSDYLRVTSAASAVPLEFFGKSKQYVKALKGQDISDGSTILYSPQYAVGGQGWITEISVINLDPSPGSLTFKLVGDNGQSIGVMRTLPIAGKGKIHITDPNFFLEVTTVTSGYVEIKSDGIRITGSVVFGDPDKNTYSSALPLVSTFPRSLVFSQIASNDDYYTGLVLLNPNDSSVTATISVFRKDGALIVSKQELLPGKSRECRLITEYFPSLMRKDIGGGYVKITSDQGPGIGAFLLIGTGGALSSMPGTPITPAVPPGPLPWWAKSYGIEGTNSAASIKQTSDGGYITVRSTDSFGAGSTDIIVLKLNADGSVAWQKSYGGKGAETATSILETSDGGYIVAGSVGTESTGPLGAGWNDICILKLNRDGTIAWQKAYGGPGDDSAQSIQQTAEGGYIVAATMDKYGANHGEFCMLKLASDGSLSWKKCFGTAYAEYGVAVRQVPDGGYVALGYGEVRYGDLGAGPRGYWVLRLRSDGIPVWQRIYGYPLGETTPKDIIATSDGGYLVVGGFVWHLWEPNGNWILKLTADGSIDWQKNYYGGRIEAAHIISDGGYVFTGVVGDSSGADYASAWRLSRNGTVLWQKKYLPSDFSYGAGLSIEPTADGGFIMIGEANSPVGGGFLNASMWVVKMQSDGSCPPLGADYFWENSQPNTDFSGQGVNFPFWDPSIGVADLSLEVKDTNAKVQQQAP
jgi:hypothetical protein